MVVRIKDDRIVKLQVFAGDVYKAYLEASKAFEVTKGEHDRSERTDPNKCKGSVCQQKIDITEV
jgi:hypothetical protein